MYKGSGPRILPIIVIIIVVALVIAALVTAGRMMFAKNSASSKTQTESQGKVVDAVLDRGETRSVRWTVRGPIVANEKFRSYQISISPSKRIYTTYSGYLEEVIDNKTYDNNANAYEQFVYALSNANVGASRNAKDTDFRGVCATQGIAYKFETLADNNADNTLWSSTCKDSKGTLAADPLKVQALFVNQIPDFKSQFNAIY